MQIIETTTAGDTSVFPLEIINKIMDYGCNPSWARVCWATHQLWNKREQIPIKFAEMVLVEHLGLDFRKIRCNKCQQHGIDHTIDSDVNILCPSLLQHDEGAPQREGPRLVQFSMAGFSECLKPAWDRFKVTRESMESTLPWQSTSLTIEYECGQVAVAKSASKFSVLDDMDFFQLSIPKSSARSDYEFEFSFLKEDGIAGWFVTLGGDVLFSGPSGTATQMWRLFAHAAKWQVTPVPLTSLNVTKSVRIDDEVQLIYIEDFKLRGEQEQAGCWGLARNGTLIWLIEASRVAEFLNLYFEEPWSSVCFQGDGFDCEVLIRDNGSRWNWPISISAPITTTAERLRCIAAEMCQYLFDIGGLDEVEMEIICEGSPVQLVAKIDNYYDKAFLTCWMQDDANLGEWSEGLSLEETCEFAFGQAVDTDWKTAWLDLGKKWTVTIRPD